MLLTDVVTAANTAIPAIQTANSGLTIMLIKRADPKAPTVITSVTAQFGMRLGTAMVSQSLPLLATLADAEAVSLALSTQAAKVVAAVKAV